ncbi:MAG: DUF2333 family protein [bacterium]|nr:DUF2333 family protein [bacterium]
MFERLVFLNRFSWFRRFWLTIMELVHDEGSGRNWFGWLRTMRVPRSGGRVGVGALAVLLAFSTFVAITDGFIPTTAPVVAKETESRGAVALALSRSIEAEREHGWMPNDLFWPTIFLSNYQNFQLGELQVWRRVTYQLREHLSRVRTTDGINPRIDAANMALNNDEFKWWLPSFEGRMEIAVNELRAYVHERRATPLSPDSRDALRRADNLRYLIEDVASAMGGMQDQLLRTLSPTHQPQGEDGAPQQMQAAPSDMETVGIFHAAGIFYHGKGEAYAALTILEAVRIEYADVLKRKNGIELTDEAIFWLREAIGLRPWFVLNSGRASIFANHLDNFAAPFSLARAKVNSLIDVLKNG